MESSIRFSLNYAIKIKLILKEQSDSCYSQMANELSNSSMTFIILNFMMQKTTFNHCMFKTNEF